MALPTAKAMRLSTVVVLWRHAAEFAVDVVDVADIVDADGDPSVGHLDVLVRRVPAATAAGRKSGKEEEDKEAGGGGHNSRDGHYTVAAGGANKYNEDVAAVAATPVEPETLRLRCGKRLYWHAAMGDGDRVLKRMHAPWLARRLEAVIDDDLVNTRDEGKSMAFADLKRELADRAKRHTEWRNLGSKKARGDAWQRYVEESASDEKKYLNTVQDIMLDDVAHRWLEIEIANSSSTSSGTISSFTAVLKPPKLRCPPRQRAKSKEGESYSYAANNIATKNQDDDDKINETEAVSYHHASFAALGRNGFADRGAHFSRKNTALQKDLTSVVTPARTEAGERSQSATGLINQACLSEDELEANRQAEYTRLEELRRLQGMDDEERFIDFLCSATQSKQEMKLTDAGVGSRIAGA